MLPRFASSLLGAIFLAAMAAAADAQIAQLRAERTVSAGKLPDRDPAVVSALALSPDAKWLISAGDDHAVRVWDLTDGRLAAEMPGHADWIRAASFHPRGAQFATAGDDHVIRIWDVATRKLLRQLPPHPQPIYALAYSPNGEWLAAAGFENAVRIYHAEDGRLLRTIKGPAQEHRALAVAPDGVTVAVGGRNGSVRILNAITGATERDLETTGRRLRTLAFSPDGAYLAAAGDGGRIDIWAPGASESSKTIVTGSALTLAMTFCGADRLATADTDNHVHVWDVNTLAELAEGNEHKGSVSALTYDAARDMLISGSFDTTLKFWPLSAIRDGDVLKQAERPGVER